MTVSGTSLRRSASRASGLSETTQNRSLADQMTLMAEVLQAQRAPASRVRAFRRAAATLRAQETPAAQLLDEKGFEWLARRVGIGEGPARAIAEILLTRRWAELDRLRGRSAPQSLFRTVKGIGPRLASRLWNTLRVDTLSGLADAARDGRLDGLREVGPQRARAVRAALDEMGVETGPRPPVSLLLSVDRAYRAGAAAGVLPLIAAGPGTAPRGPGAPVLHVEEGGWNVTSMFPAERRANAPDAVMLFTRLREGPESQWRVVTRPGGPGDMRVVLGRESECPPLA